MKPRTHEEQLADSVTRGKALLLLDMLTGQQPHVSAGTRRTCAIKMARHLLAEAQALPRTMIGAYLEDE